MLKKGLIQFNANDNLTRYFWTADINPDNTFEIRYKRWHRLIKLAQDLNYTFHNNMPIQKWTDELNNLKKIYDENKTKKVYIITPN